VKASVLVILPSRIVTRFHIRCSLVAPLCLLRVADRQTGQDLVRCHVHRTVELELQDLEDLVDRLAPGAEALGADPLALDLAASRRDQDVVGRVELVHRRVVRLRSRRCRPRGALHELDVFSRHGREYPPAG
jgi:hypothetical protein